MVSDVADFRLESLQLILEEMEEGGGEKEKGFKKSNWRITLKTSRKKFNRI